MNCARAAKRIDLENKILVPGFIDSHEHIIRQGLRVDWVPLKSPPIETLNDIIKALAVKSKEKQKGEWIARAAQ
jgi:predicted amidohydrolase YtcJ